MSWTEEEEGIIRRDYVGTNRSVVKLSERLGRNYHTLRGKINRLGLRKCKDRTRWTEREELKLAGLVTRYSIKTVAKQMGRSENSISVKARRMRLSLLARDGWFTKLDVAETLGVDRNWVQSRIDSKELKASWHNRRKPHGGAKWHISTEDLKSFILGHKMELTGRNVDLPTVLDIVTGEIE